MITACQLAPGRWDLDVGTYLEWVRAQAECRSCPVLQGCRELLARFYPHRGGIGEGPQSVVWAATAYGYTGAPLTDAQLRSVDRRRGHRPARVA